MTEMIMRNAEIKQWTSLMYLVTERGLFTF